jgi:AcrR family transcriptional regulator
MRARIVDATIGALARHGYGATTTLLVQKVGGLSRGAMLHHFPTKADLILATIERIVDLNGAFFEAKLSELPGPVERFLALIDLRWELLNQPHGIAQAEILVGARSDETVRSRYPEFLQRLRARQLARLEGWAEAAGVTLTEEDRRLTRLFVYALHGMAVERQIDPTIDPDPVLQLMRDLRDRNFGDRLGAARVTGKRP